VCVCVCVCVCGGVLTWRMVSKVRLRICPFKERFGLPTRLDDQYSCETEQRMGTESLFKIKRVTQHHSSQC
jgi:hypothetical protein